MFLTTKGRYAMMAMVELGNQTSQPMTLRVIGDKQGIDVGYLEQIFHNLRKAGLVRAIKGPGGGYVLDRPAEQILMSDIINAVNENTKITRCNNNPENGCMKSGVRCATHNLWAAMEEHIRQFMTDYSLADICAGHFSKIAEGA